MERIGSAAQRVVMNAGYLALDAATVRSVIERMHASFPELAGDAELAADTFEGETDLLSVLRRAVEQKAEADMMVEALARRQALLAERAARLGRKSDAMRDLIKGLMKSAKLPSVTLPEATISLRAGKSSVGIENLDDLPQGFFKTKREADKAAIKKALEAGETVPGAILVQGQESLSIRMG